MRTHRLIALAALAVLIWLHASPAVARWPEASPAASFAQAKLTKPTGVDLDVTYISRAPRYNRYSVWYTVDGRPYLQPGTENDRRWPEPGEAVTFTAHIANKGTVASGDFAFKWFVDDTEVATGVHASLDPGQEAAESYQWAWGHALAGERLLGSHRVRFSVDPAGQISETYEINNSLEDRTEALSLVMALSPAAYAALESPLNPQWPFSAEDWLQKQIAAMNAAFQQSVFASAPAGILTRVRIDQILVSASAPAGDPTRDGAWYIASDVRGGAYYSPVTDVDGGLLHELTHQLGIIDMYNLDVGLETPQVLDQRGQPIQMEYSTGYLFPGLMNNPGVQPPAYDEHTALALNANHGYRRGYYGEYLYDVSDQVYLRVLDNEGQPAPGATVKLYQRSQDPGQYGAFFGTIDNTPEITGVTDANGMVLLANRAVGQAITTQTGHVLHDNPFGLINVVGNDDEFILEVRQGGHQEFSWLDITALNLALWRGAGSATTLDIHAHVPPADAPMAPPGLTGLQETGLVKLQWAASPSPGVTSYNLYRTGNEAYPYQRIVTGTTALSYSGPYAYGLRAATYVVTAVDSQGKESGFSDPFYAFRLSNPMGLVVDEQNGRIVLDPQNGYALLYQLDSGLIFDTRGSVDYHFEFSQHIARDAEGRLILSHPGDAYSARHSVRVADQDARPLLEFGDQGSGDGQFQTPAGVAAWGQTCSIEGPYSADAHTLLLLHFDDSTNGAQGEIGSANGVTFTDGRYAQSVTVGAGDSLTYPSAGNLNRTEGAVEFWVRPHWNGNDAQSHTFFEAGAAWFNRLRVMKDGANNLRFLLWDSATEYGIAYNVAGWQAGEWHHVAATWSGSNIALYVDGEQVASSSSANPPDSLAATLYVGSSLWLDQQAEADIDELRISDLPRNGNSDTCSYRILVADSGNHRIQAFDALGNFIATYGSPGSGPGQFNNPQGLAVDENGQVVVADQGNNRVQVLSFDGSSFGFVRSIGAGLSGPTGVATYGTDRILVADTGNNEVKVLAADGSLVAAYDAPNDGRSGTFNQPRGVVADRSARIIVADTGNQRVVSILGALPTAPVAWLYLPLILHNSP